MKAFVLAAGFGTRLKPLTEEVPKPLIPVRKIPMIFYTLALLKAQGITDIVMNLHHLGDHIVDVLAEHKHWGFNITYSKENPILGTGGGIAKALDQLSDDFLVINADVITDFQILDLAQIHNNADNLATLAVRQSENMQDLGILTFDQQKITSILSKSPPANHQKSHFTGIHMISKKRLKNFLEQKQLPKTFCIVRDVYMKAFDQNLNLGAFLHKGYWNDCGTFESLTQAENILETSQSLSYQKALEEIINLFTKI